MARKDAFQPLGEPDFAVLEDRGKVKFPAMLRKELNGELEQLCSPAGDRFVHSEAKAAAGIRACIARDAGSLLATLCKLQATTRPGAATEPGARLAAWLLFPLERHDDPHYFPEEIPEEWRTLSPLIAKLETLCWWAEHQAGRLPEPSGGRGRPADLWLRYFIVLVADAFEEAGGTVSAARQATEDEDGKRRRNTPYLRVLFYIHERLPGHRRAASEQALADQAYDVLAMIKPPQKQGTGKVKRGKKRG